jgi:hypothetical protein
MQTQMDCFHEPLTTARSQITTVNESVVRQAGTQSGNIQDAFPQLQLDSTLSGLTSGDILSRPEDEELIKQMRLREEHFIVVAQNLTHEVEDLNKKLGQAIKENHRLANVNAILEN